MFLNHYGSEDDCAELRGQVCLSGQSTAARPGSLLYKFLSSEAGLCAGSQAAFKLDPVQLTQISAAWSPEYQMPSVLQLKTILGAACTHHPKTVEGNRYFSNSLNSLIQILYHLYNLTPLT